MEMKYAILEVINGEKYEVIERQLDSKYRIIATTRTWGDAYIIVDALNIRGI